HVLLAGEEWLLPQNRLAAPDTRHALHIDRQLANQQFGAEAGGAQLGMGEIEIVLPLGDMVGELVAERKADAARRAVAVDEIDADDLRLLAPSSAKAGLCRSPPGAASVEPSPL